MYRIASCLLVLSLMTGVAQAAVNPSEVDDAMRARDWPRAERMLLDVIVDKPKLAKPHYYLAQVYEQEKRFASAAQELATAERLDPELKFSKNPAKYRAMKSRLAKALESTEARKRARAESTPAYIPAPVVPKTPELTASRSSSVEPLPTVVPPPGAVSSSKSAAGGLTVVLVIGLLLAGGAGLFVYFSRKAKRDQDAADNRLRRDELKQVMDRKDEVDKALLDAKLEGKGDSFIGQELARLSAGLMEHAESLHRTSATWKTESATRRDVLRQAREAIALARNGQYDRPAPAAPPVAAPAPAPSIVTSNTSTYGHGHHHHHTTVLHDRNDLAEALQTAILVDALTSHHRHEERVVERVVEREVPVYREPAYERDVPESAPLDLDSDDIRRDTWEPTPPSSESLDLSGGSSWADTSSSSGSDSSSSSSSGGWD